MTERRSTMDHPPAGPAVAFELSQKIRYQYDRPVAQLHQQLKVVPPVRHGRQVRRRWHLQVDGAEPSRVSEVRDRFGNLTVEVAVPHVAEVVEFTLEVDVAIDGPEGPHEAAYGQRYARPTALTAAERGIAELVDGVDPGDVGQLCSRIHGALTYEWGITGVATTAEEALAGGRGVCQDYAHVMLAACRYLGLAARYVSGHLVGEGGSHAWVEVLHRQPGEPERCTVDSWDPTHDRRTDGQYVVVAVGRDYRDAAPMSGTYVGPGARGDLTVRKALRVS